MIIYNSDGSERYISNGHEITIRLNSEDFIGMRNTAGGATLYYKDGNNIFIENAYVRDGNCLEILT